MTTIPKIPQKGSHQYIVIEYLIKHANDPFLKHVWIVNIDGLSHGQFIGAISKLREEKDWPIEDTPGCNDQHGYRLDKERWAVIKHKISI